MKDKIDQLVWEAVFGLPERKRQVCLRLVKEAEKQDISLASNHNFYLARGRGECSGITVPCFNLRTLTYEAARAVFRAARQKGVAAFQFELARSEIDYTDQRPAEYTAVILAAAIKEKFPGPVFIVGDHLQVNAQKYDQDPVGERDEIKALIKEAIGAGWYNLDIDASTLVDLEKPSLDSQQKLNYQVSAQLTQDIRRLQPAGVTIGIGVEIGEVGGKNSTPGQLRAFMDGYLKTLKKLDSRLEGPCKISVQTGTTHGGVVLPDGSLAQVKVDFQTLNKLSRIAKDEYGLAGAVQHGASTLPESAFALFPQSETAEIHLATNFQNIILDHPKFPVWLKKRMYHYLEENYSQEKKEDQTKQQFYYQMRKKALGPFKKEIWGLEEKIKQRIAADLETKFAFLFEQLNVAGVSLLTYFV